LGNKKMIVSLALLEEKTEGVIVEIAFALQFRFLFLRTRIHFE